MDEKVKQKLLLLLDKFVSVCEQQGLQYYLAGGSVLGAVRHKGFIPWDDDIDVYMMREDYEKIQTLPNKVWGEGFRLASWRKTKNYTYDFLKLELTDTTVIERLHPVYVGGVFLDIFPLDYVSTDEKERSKQLKAVKAVYQKFVESYITQDCECSNVFQLMQLNIRRFRNRKPDVLDKWERLVSAEVKSKSLMVDYHSPWMHRPLPSEYIGSGIPMEFEGKSYIVPSKPDAYLRHVYGDYMQLPPKEKQVGHAFDYINLERRISDQEAKEIVRMIKNKYRYHSNLKHRIKNLLHKIKG